MFIGGYEKPFMITYLSTASFTLYLVPFYLRRFRTGSMSWQRNNNYEPLAQDTPAGHEHLAAQPLHGADDRLTSKETANLALFFCFIWFAANWTLNASLAYTSVASATILASMSGIFTLAVGHIFQVETLTLLKIGAVLTSFGGVVLVSLSDSSSTTTMPELPANPQSINLVAMLGDALALFSAMFYATYSIFLKVQIKEESRIDMQLFFGFVGLFNVTLCWPVALVLHWLGIESLEFPDSKQAVMAILVNMFITLLSDYIYVIAMLKTTPLVVTVGLSLTIPFAVVGDYFLGKVATLQVLVGAVLVTAAFIVVGIQNSKPRQGLLAQDLVGEGIGQQAQHRLGETVSAESQTNASDI